MDAQRGIARRMVIGLPREGLSPAWERDFAAYPPAGVIVFRRDFEDLVGLRRLTSRLRELARPRRLFIAIDEEGGGVSQISGLMVVPPNAALLARGAAPGDIEWVSRVTGERLRALGVDWVFAPVADVHSEPLNPVIGPRAFGTTPGAVAAALTEALAGFGAARIALCLKHFPGHGDTAVDSHLALPVCRADRATLERREIAPFRAHSGADAVMSAHVVYPALDPARPATFSRPVVHGLLRESLGFRGVCITDALEMKGASGEHSITAAARLALEAGCDLLLFAFHDESVRRSRLELAKLLVDGAIDRANFDAARPRLAAFDARRPEPGEAELARPFVSLTPGDWEERLERIIRRGLVVREEGASDLRAALSSAGTCEISEPEWLHGGSLREALEDRGVSMRPASGPAEGVPATSGDDPSRAASPGQTQATPDGRTQVSPAIEAIASRTPLSAGASAALRRRCASRPTVLLGLQNDAFLDSVPEAAARISASDATPLTRRVVAGRVADLLLRAAAARPR